MKKYAVYQIVDSVIYQHITRVPVRIVQTDESTALDILADVKAASPADTFELVSFQFKAGINPNKLRKFERDSKGCVVEHKGKPVLKINKTCLVHNSVTVKVV